MASLEFTPPVTGFSWGREGGEGGGGGHTCLDDEDVLVPDRLPKLNRCLIVAELIQDHLGARLGSVHQNYFLSIITFPGFTPTFLAMRAVSSKK